MGVNTLTPYLFFDNGQAADAVALYENALGATVDSLQRYGDVPNSGADADASRVMHAQLRIDGNILMISDSPTARPTTVGRNVQLTLDFDDLDDTKARFAALAESGTVVSALEETFWGAHFGVVEDAFGVFWMFNCQKAG